MPGAGASSMTFWWRAAWSSRARPGGWRCRSCRPAPGTPRGAGSPGTSPCRHVVAEGRAGLGLGQRDRVQQRRVGVHHAHAAPAAAAGGLDDDRVADLAGHLQRALGCCRRGAVGARHAGHAGLLHARMAETLSPIRRMVSGLGPMKTKPERSTRSAKSAFSDRKP
jgi:hypothetical protein